MAKWEDTVKFCNEHYENCYNCPIRGACWEERRDKKAGGRSSQEYKNDMIKAFENISGESQ